MVDDDGDGVVLGVGALDASVEDEPRAIVEGDRTGSAGVGEGFVLTELRDGELVDGVLDEEANGDASAILGVVGGVVGAVGGVEIGYACVGVDLVGDVVGDGLVLNFFECDDVGRVEDVANGERDLLQTAGVCGLRYVDCAGDKCLSCGEDGGAGAAVEAVDSGRNVVEVVGRGLRGIVEALDVEGGDGELLRTGRGYGLHGDAGRYAGGVVGGVDEEASGDVVVVVAVGEVEDAGDVGQHGSGGEVDGGGADEKLGVDEDAFRIVVEDGGLLGGVDDGIAEVDAGLAEGTWSAGDDGVEGAVGGVGLGCLGERAARTGDSGERGEGDAHAFIRRELVDAARGAEIGCGERNGGRQRIACAELGDCEGAAQFAARKVAGGSEGREGGDGAGDLHEVADGDGGRNLAGSGEDQDAFGCEGIGVGGGVGSLDEEAAGGDGGDDAGGLDGLADVGRGYFSREGFDALNDVDGDGR